MTSQSAIKRYTAIVRRPFTARDFIETTGLNPRTAVRALRQAANRNQLNYLGGMGESAAFVTAPQKPPKYNDFTPDRQKLMQVQALLTTTGYTHWTDIVEQSGMGKRTIQRYLAMLEHLGCAVMRKAPLEGAGRYRSVYKATKKTVPWRIPPFFRSISKTWRQP